MSDSPLDLVVARLRSRVENSDELVRSFAEWLGVHDQGSAPPGSGSGLWSPREVAIVGLHERVGRASARSFEEGVRWLRKREYFRPHHPPGFEADPLAILGVAIGLGLFGEETEGLHWIREIARQALDAESDPWRIALLDAVTDRPIRVPELAVALAVRRGVELDQSDVMEAFNASLSLDDPPRERAAARLCVLTRERRIARTTTSVRGPTVQAVDSAAVSRKKALHELLLSLFVDDELRTWIGHDSILAEISNELPGRSASKSEVTSRFVDRLDARGMIDSGFFARLRSERPRRRSSICDVARLWGV